MDQYHQFPNDPIEDRSKICYRLGELAMDSWVQRCSDWISEGDFTVRIRWHQKFHEILWKSMKFYEILWNSMKFYEILWIYIYIYIHTILYLYFPVSHMAFIKSLIETSMARVYCWDDPRQVNHGPIMFYRNRWWFSRKIWVPQNGWFISWKVVLNGWFI